MKIIKILLRALGVLVFLLVVAAVFIQFRGIPSYDTVDFDYSHTSSPEALVRGGKLVRTLCAACHMNGETGKLTGKQMLDAPKEFGTVYSPNITQDREFGIGDWTDAEIVYLLRTGVKKDGQYAPPWMAKLPHLADADMNAIISFLRSDDPAVAPDAVEDYPSEPSFLTKFLTQFAFTPLPLPDGPIALPDTANLVELGQYLAINLECYSCHSADFKTNNSLSPELSAGFFGGGNKPLNLEGKVIMTQNLTPDPESGIGKWSGEQFLKAVKYGQKEGEPALRYPMLPQVFLTDHEVLAIYAYLKTIPPINNKVVRTNL